MSQFRPHSRAFSSSLGRRAWLSKAAYTSAVTLQIACAIHLVNEHAFEIRNSTGASMLPTLAPEGDFLLQLRLPFARFLSSLRGSWRDGKEGEGEERHPYRKRGRIGGLMFSKTDQAQGTGLRVGDLVVALSPFDPSRTVCKRVIGLPGDTVALDPRMRPLPMSVWRGQKQPPPPPSLPDETQLDTKLVKFEDILSPHKTITTPPPAEVDLLKSMDTDSTTHNELTSTDLQRNTYVRSKGDVQYVTIPLGHVWLAGDNMANSTDSRHYGPVPLGMVRGKVLARVWPNPRWLGSNLTDVD
ncbi:Mitochondrial inner membrane protease subunit 1 [Pseudozyma hubeiensis]|nr:Mitochondrial inner membrane protease subunit 1 [Pseudozyma hubeiensis]